MRHFRESGFNRAAPHGYGSYLIFLDDAGNTCALNQMTGSGAIEFWGSDAGPVLRSAMAGIPFGGVLIMKSGMYNVQTLGHDTDNGYDAYYAIAVPGYIGSPNVPGYFSIQGEGRPTEYLQTGGPLNGTNINITAAAVATVPAGKSIIAVHHKADSDGSGNEVWFDRMGVLFPDNTRNSVFGFYMREAVGVSFTQCNAAFNQAYDGRGDLLTAPGTSSVGFSMQASNKLWNGYARDCMAQGFDYGWQIPNEHAVLDSCASNNCRIAIRLGGISGSMIHPVHLKHFVDNNCISGLQIASGSTCAGALLIVEGYDVQTYSAGVFARTSDATESSGVIYGEVTYTHVAAGVGIQSRKFFEVGQGAGFGKVWCSSDGPYPYTGRITHNTTQSIAADAAFHAVAFNTEIKDPNGWHDTGSPSPSNTRVTNNAVNPCKAHFRGNVEFATGTGSIFLQLRKNGSTVFASVDHTVSAAVSAIEVSGHVELAAGDYVELLVKNGLAGATNINNVSEYSPMLSWTAT